MSNDVKGEDTMLESNGTESTSKFAEKATYKPPIGAVGTPIEKYDRRHFGPRLENSEEVSSTTTDTTYIDASSLSSISSTSSSFSSSSLLPEFWSSSPDSANGTRKANRNRDSGVVADDEKFVEVNKGEGNEAYVGTIDRIDEGDSKDRRGKVEIGISLSIAESSELPQLSTAISKLSDKVEQQAVHVTTSGSDGDAGSVGVVDETDDETTAGSHEIVDKLELTILGLFELTQGTEPRPEGPSELQAARLAVDRINEMDILPKIRLRLIHNDTRVRFFLYCTSFSENSLRKRW